MPPSIPPAPRRILVPVDFADGSRVALHEAGALAATKTEIVLLHVIDPAFFGHGSDAAANFADESIVSDCAHHLCEVREAVLGSRVGCSVLVRQGPADLEILRAIGSLKPDLVVMATDSAFDARNPGKGRSRTARAVLERSSCPVLLLSCS